MNVCCQVLCCSLLNACRYDLVSIVVHHGHSVSSGHYVAYVKSAAGIWHLCDDSRVCRVKPEAVFKQQAYLLLYARRTPRASHLPVAARAENGDRSAQVAAPTAASKLEAKAAGAVQTRAKGAVPGPCADASAPPQPQPAAPHLASRSVTAGAAPQQAQHPHAAAAAAEPAVHASPGGAAQVSATPPRNTRVSRAMARNIGIHGRSTKNLHLLQSACSKGRVMLQRVAGSAGAAQLRTRPEQPEVSAKENCEPSPDGTAQVPFQRECAPSPEDSDDGEHEPLAQAQLQRDGGAEAVRIEAGADALLRGPGRRQLPEVGTWDDVDPAEAKAAQKLVQKTQPKRRMLDAHDEEYDRGRTKKVRKKGGDSAGPGAAKFVAAASGEGAARNGKAVQRAGGKKRPARVAAMQTRPAECCWVAIEPGAS
jgi:Ubiquitin carboxyl-terminal hydrolase